MKEEEEGLAEPRKQALLVCAPTPCLRPNRLTAGHPLVLAELKLIPTAGILTKGSHGNKALLQKKKKKAAFLQHQGTCWLHLIFSHAFSL